ncbi:MAG: cation diffusion facilitator family transporter, partial [Proteobacteria bacterium]|nr:cation diffusion facilitator family transporter [Pseudomonadota bacterium]
MKSLQMASFISLVLAIAKGAAFGMTGSLIVLSSFLDSVMDTILSWVNFRLSKESKVNADKQHPYGHGGFEVIGGLVQGFLIGGSGVFIVFQTLERVLQNSVSESLRLKNLPLATGILVFSILGSSIITWLLARSSSKNAKDLIRSLSIEADRSHYQGDVLPNVIALIGMGATVFFENPSIDTIAGGFSGLLL